MVSIDLKQHMQSLLHIFFWTGNEKVWSYEQRTDRILVSYRDTYEVDCPQSIGSAFLYNKETGVNVTRSKGIKKESRLFPSYDCPKQDAGRYL